MNARCIRMMTVTLLVITARSAMAVVITTTTDKTQYYRGEPVHISVTATNPSPVPVTLFFSSSCQADAGVDGAPPFQMYCLMVITHVDIPAFGSHTWTFTRVDLATGLHCVVGYVDGYGSSGPVWFQVLDPGLPTRNFMVTFEGMQTTTQLAGYGIHVRSLNGGAPSLGGYNGNTYLTSTTCTYPTGFNIVVDFDMPVYGVGAKVSAAAGYHVTMIARDAQGQVLGSVASGPTAYLAFVGPISLQCGRPIASVEWWPSQSNSAVLIDDLQVMIPGDTTKPDLDADGDVDQADFGRFQICLTGPGVAVTPSCQNSDLNHDGFVDENDLAMFDCCLSGPATSTGPGCRN